jgi:hypothetical protein
MWERAALAREDSDTAYFNDLLYLGEMVTKLVAAGLIAAVLDDRDRSRYQQLHRLVRASGIGEWAQAIDDVLIGPAAAQASEAMAPDRAELTAKAGPSLWQYQAVSELHAALCLIDSPDPLPTKVQARQWFALFARLRNKSRGHGALPMSQCSEAAPRLEMAIRVLSENLALLRRPWAYLHQNLSGKYRVSPFGGDSSAFHPLKSSAGQKQHLPNGVYIFGNEPLRVDLILSDVDLRDFYFANGGFTGKKFEFLS